MPLCKNTALIVAAGRGSRFGSEKPKQFLLLDGYEILSYSVQAFLNHPQIHEVIVITSESFVDPVSHHYPKCRVILGGTTRQESVFHGLEACSSDTEIVLIHDAARPLVPSRVIDDCLKQLESFDGIAPALTPTDSMIQVTGNTFRNLKRDNLRVLQTPQCFHIDILRQAHVSGKIDTDEMGLVKQAVPQAKLGFIEGSYSLMKITLQRDINIISDLLKHNQDQLKPCIP